jgi:hypothetical protein
VGKLRDPAISLVYQTQMQRQLRHLEEARQICVQPLEAAAGLFACAKDDLKAEARRPGVSAPALIAPGAG